MEHGPYDSFYRRRRPHWQHEGAWHFITFRLEGTLPTKTIQRLNCESEEIIKLLKNKYPGKTETQAFNYYQWRFEWIDKYLDKQTDLIYLRNNKVAKIVKEALFFYEPNKYKLDAWVIMPNHVHLLIEPNKGIKLNKVLQRIKSYTGKEINALLNLHGPFWQGEGFDHWVRPGNLMRWQKYIINNPVIAGLCKSPEDWVWSSAYKLSDDN